MNLIARWGLQRVPIINNTTSDSVRLVPLFFFFFFVNAQASEQLIRAIE